MNFKSQVISKVIAILALIQIVPLIFPQTALIIVIFALTQIVPLIFPQIAFNNLITLSDILKDCNHQLDLIKSLRD